MDGCYGPRTPEHWKEASFYGIYMWEAQRLEEKQLGMFLPGKNGSMKYFDIVKTIHESLIEYSLREFT